MYALESKGVAYEHDELFPFMERRRLKKLNPEGKIPVLEMDGKIITDSNDMVRALDEKYPEKRRLFPADPTANAATVELVTWIESTFPDAVGTPLVAQRIVRPHYGKKKPDEKVVAAGLKALPDVFAKLESKAPSDGFFIGSEITIADSFLWGWLRAAEIAGGKVDAAQCPKLTAWYGRMSTDDVCIRTNQKYSATAAVKKAIDMKY